jgi:hypothetical protein
MPVGIDDRFYVQLYVVKTLRRRADHSENGIKLENGYCDVNQDPPARPCLTLMEE